MVSNAKVTTSVKLDKETKEEAKKIFKKLGINMGDAFNIFLSKVVLEKGIPFDLKLPNETTLKAMEETEKNIHMEKTSLEEFIAEREEKSA